MNHLETDLRAAIRDIPDFPKPGILFKDITPVFLDPALCERVLEAFASHFNPGEIDAIVGIESRGFLFGLALATRLKKPFILIRKAGKLPAKTVRYAYELEYGEAVIEIHEGAIKPGWKVLVHDDLLATGGTASAAGILCEQVGGEVMGFSFLVNLGFLNGKALLSERFPNVLVKGLVTYY